jgi:hypothetical protein
MQKSGLLWLVCASLLSQSSTHAASYADSVQGYVPGTGFATDFATGAGYTNAAAALGEPSRSTPGQFGGPIDPFNPPYLKEQLVSLGAGGSLTVGFAAPILNRASNPFGVDFIVYGHTGFVITNGDYSGGGVTDGSLFGANPGATRVSVSPDNVTYYQLDPARAPVVDGSLFPTDGSGSFDLAVNPTLPASDFAGRGLEGIRSLYNGSGGGTGFDLSWALDAQGKSVFLPEVKFVRIDVLTGVADVDGFAVPGAVPEPSTWGLLSLGLGMVWLAKSRAENCRACA